MDARRRTTAAALVLGAASLILIGADGPSNGAGVGEKKILVELYTSEGCDMCPGAEELLGRIATPDKAGARIIPLAFHVDYFNDPWVDSLSSKAYSERELAYNTVLKRNDLYFTPMLMVDGRTPMLGSNAPFASRSIAAALREAPGADLTLAWDGPEAGGSRRLKLTVTPRAAMAGRATLVGVATTEDHVAVRVQSGENAGKTLDHRYPVRSFTFENVRLAAGDSKTLHVPLRLREGADARRVAVVAFAQDWADGRIQQAETIPWVDPPAPAIGPAGSSRP